MKILENQTIADEYKQRILGVVTGERELTRRPQGERDYSVWHLTEGTTLCPEADRLVRATPNPHPPHSFRTGLKFFMGRAFEDSITTPCRIQAEGISGEIDDFKLDAYLRELKCTHDSMINFEPKPWWISQIMGYCHLAELYTPDLIVLFWAGNLMSYTPWGRAELKGAELRYNPIDIKAYSIEFEKTEVEENWKSIHRTIDNLKDHVRLKHPMSKEEIEACKPVWMCKQCRWQPEYCWYWKKYINKEV